MVFKPTNTMQKKANVKVDNKITTLVGALIVIILAVELAPQMFTGISGLEDNADVPGWVSAIMYVIVGAGLVFIIWNTFKK